MSGYHVSVTVLIAVFIVSLGSVACAHKPLLAVEDNMDGTMYIEGAFSDGSSAAGHQILIKDKQTGKTLSEQRVGEDGTLELKKPSVPFTVTLDAGEGHTVTVDGPPPAKGGAVSDAGAAEKPAPASAAKQAETPPAPERREAVPTAAPAPTPAQGPASAPVVTASTGGISPGAFMAFKMMMITQVVTAVAILVLVVILAYYVGYVMGRNSGLGRRKEV